ncbi:MAG: LAGLIDADG family homing endonuclease [Candidatus ainarchaeum sp.]|nr:LAGLIDADG family homing endonuclease [Candidatus ainarchaeum sp.]
MEFNTYDGGIVSITEKELECLHWNEHLSIRQIAKKLNICASTLRKAMAKNNISRRETAKKILNKPTKEVLEKLYFDSSLPLKDIIKKFGVSYFTFFKWLKEYNIPKNRRAKLEMHAFSNNSKEKAYLQGLVFGDIHARKHCRQVVAELSTTHSSMINLFCKVFSNYGVVRKSAKYNKKTGRFGWAVRVSLDSSFDFLLSKKIEDIADEYFYYFLAGFFDCEGCLFTYNNHNYIGLSLLLYNCNKNLLEHIFKKLEKDGFNPRLNKASSKGTKTSDGYCQRKDCWSVSLYASEEVKRLLEYMPFRHDERLRKAEFVLSIGSPKKWKDIANDVISLRNQIKEEVKISVSQAVEQWKIKQGGFDERGIILQKIE